MPLSTNRKRGSAGMCAVVAETPQRHFPYSPQLLVHRRSRNVDYPLHICAPGGMIRRRAPGTGEQFHDLARDAAVRELAEEAGWQLTPDEKNMLIDLPATRAQAVGGKKHRNFGFYYR